MTRGQVGGIRTRNGQDLKRRDDLIDMRLPSSKAAMQRRSVNLAISSRGLAALEFVDSQLAARFLESAIPMRGRIIHDENGSNMQVYDPAGGVSGILRF